jgi:hydrogenase/urease accessory protein HupE
MTAALHGTGLALGSDLAYRRPSLLRAAGIAVALAGIVLA